MTTVLVSKPFLAEYGRLIDEALSASGRDCELLPFPAAGSLALASADYPRVDAALLSRDIRFSPQALSAFGEIVPACPNIQWVHIGSSGTSQYKWLPALLGRAVMASSSTGANAEPVAQTAFMGLLMLARRARHWVDMQREHRWAARTEPDVPPDLAGQTLLIVGMGSIGCHVARYAKAFGLNVIGIRRGPRRDDDLADTLAPPADFGMHLPRADWLILACALNEQSRGLIGREALDRIKPGAGLINISRGEVVDEGALIEALRSGRLGGAYLDVFQQEPLPADSPFWDLPNTFIGPHNAAASAGNNHRSAAIFARNLAHYLRGEPLLNRIAN